MAYSDAQNKKFDKEIAKMTRILSRTLIATRQTGSYVTSLEEKNFYIAALLVANQMIEHSMRLVIDSFQHKIKIMGIAGFPDPFVHITSLAGYAGNLNDLTRLLEKFIPTDPIIKKLDTYREDYRNKYVHHIFDGTYDITKAEEDAKSFMLNGGFKEVLIGLGEIQNQIRREAAAIFNSDEPLPSPTA